jgi:hypothetical protein
MGLAAHDWGGSGGPPAYAWVKLNSDGTADVVTGTQDSGTGTRTALTQVAAEALGLPIERAALPLDDTANGPYAPVSSGSATQATLGPAVRAAAAEAKRQLLAAAATILEVKPARLRLRDGQIGVQGKRKSQAITVAEVTRRIAPHMIQGQGARGPNPQDKSVRTFGVQCVEVEVDVETGEGTVLRVVAAHDCGRIINPMLKVWAFALVGVAVVLRLDAEAQRIEAARLILSGVAPIPWRLMAAEQTLMGTRVSDALFARAAEVALAAAEPLSQNAYKIPLAQALIRRGLAALTVGATVSA